MRKTILILTLICVGSLRLLPQDVEIVEEDFNDAEFFFARGEYEEAAYYYRQVLKQFPENANFNFKLGECYLNISGNENLAVEYLEIAVSNIVEKKKYRRKDIHEERAPLHAYFYLGNAYRYNNQLSEALEAYDAFISSPFYYGNYNVAIVENEIKSCERAKIIQDNPVDITEEILDNRINTSVSEFNPVISSDEEMIFFIRRLKFYDAIYMSVKEDGSWGEPINLNPILGSDGDLYPACISFDKKELYLVNVNSGNRDIYVSYFDQSTWTKAAKISGKINSMFDETSVWISDDGETLYFSSSRKGGVGGLDLYYAKRKKDGTWNRPRNMGKTINTGFDEENPCLVNGGETIYFSSKGHYNMGGYDVFFSNKSEDDWEEPVNVGYPLNNTGDNIQYSFLKGGSVVYYSRPGNAETSGENIYRVVIHSNRPLIQTKASQVKR